MSIFGFPIVTSEMLVIPDPEGRTEEVGHSDWRERLVRNLSRRSTGRWESLTFQRTLMVPDPNFYLMPLLPRGTFIMHPAVLATLKAFTSTLAADLDSAALFGRM